MTMRIRASMIVTLALAMMGLASCDHYVCTNGAQFGATTCTAGPAGLGQGTGGNTTAAFVFAVDTSSNTIDGFTVDTTAETFQATTGYTGPAIPTNDGGVGMVVAQSQFLYAGFGLAGQLFGWTISSTGTLSPISGVSPLNASFLTFEGGEVGQGIMTTDPAGSYLFIADNEQDLIYVFTIGSGGVLSAASNSPVATPSGFAPENLSTDGLGKYLYATNGNPYSHTGSEIAAWSIGTNGALTPVSGSPFSGSSPNFQMWLLKGEPTGKFMIGTTGNSAAAGFSGVDDLHLYVYSIGSTGALTPVSGSPFTTTYSPFDIAVQSNAGGNLVYSFSFNDADSAFNPIEGYSISSSGTLTADANSPFAVGEGSWGQFDQSGAFLVDYASYETAGTNTVTTQLSPVQVGSGGALTQPIPTLTLTTPGFWVVTDPQ